jgi:predicted CXXCH cytochrome family protein
VAEGAALCADCHKDLMAGESTAVKHAPFEAEECESCHEPHASDEPGMIVAEQGELCTACHSEIPDEIATASSRHDPVTSGECTACHSPHQSQLNQLLLVQSPDLCLNCHDDMKDGMESEIVHPPAARDCARCHMPHSSPQATLLSEPTTELCGMCHGYDEIEFRTAHLEIDPAVMTCTNCHNPHYSTDPKLFQAEVHAPFAMGSCEECHEVGGR